MIHAMTVVVPAAMCSIHVNAHHAMRSARTARFSSEAMHESASACAPASASRRCGKDEILNMTQKPVYIYKNMRLARCDALFNEPESGFEMVAELLLGAVQHGDAAVPAAEGVTAASRS